MARSEKAGSYNPYSWYSSSDTFWYLNSIIVLSHSLSSDLIYLRLVEKSVYAVEQLHRPWAFLSRLYISRNELHRAEISTSYPGSDIAH